MKGITVIGIDPASSKAAFVALHGDDFIVKSAQKLGKSGGHAAYNAWRVTERFVKSLPWEFSEGGVFAFIESPVVGRGGVRTTMVQCFTSGAIQGALHGFGIPAQVANVSSWKKQVVGRGNATKEDVAEYLRLRRPALFRAAAGDQDVMDAACIALFGQAITRSRMA